ncbi:MAG TPA: hypothetical protein VG649_19670 [Candidatus Angelobacter sp.]|nr:hypothetical protein [Candidatus Angelobacter sp.]
MPLHRYGCMCGKIVNDSSGNLALQVAPNQSFTIATNDLSKAFEPLADAPTVITVLGQLYKKSSGKKKPNPSAPLKLVILEVQEKE